MQIVSMTAEHVSRLAELEKLCFSEPWSEKSLTEEIDNPAACFLVAMQQDEVLGYGGMHTVLGESYVDNIAVFPEFRGHGVGRTLMAALIEKARENGGVFIAAGGADIKPAGHCDVPFARLYGSGCAPQFLYRTKRGCADFYALLLNF